MEFPTNEEHVLIKDSILLPIVMNILSDDLNKMERLTLKMQQVYIELLQSKLDAVHADLVNVRKQLKESDIRVYEVIKDEKAVHFKYTCRGYDHKGSILRFRMNAEVKEKLKILLFDSVNNN